jgi:hypothetical protein
MSSGWFSHEKQSAKPSLRQISIKHSPLENVSLRTEFSIRERERAAVTPFAVHEIHGRRSTGEKARL